MAQNADALTGFAGARVFAEDGNSAARGFGKSAENAQQGCFARAVTAQQRQARATVDVEGYIAERWIVTVILPHAFDAHRARRRHDSTLRLRRSGVDADAEFAQYFFWNRRWRFAHQVRSACG